MSAQPTGAYRALLRLCRRQARLQVGHQLLQLLLALARARGRGRRRGQAALRGEGGGAVYCNCWRPRGRREVAGGRWRQVATDRTLLSTFWSAGVPGGPGMRVGPALMDQEGEPGVVLCSSRPALPGEAAKLKLSARFSAMATVPAAGCCRGKVGCANFGCYLPLHP